MKFTKEGAALLVIDVQEGLASAMVPDKYERLQNRTVAAIKGAVALGIPVIATEQYPKGLKATAPKVAEVLPTKTIEKIEFSACVPEVRKQLQGKSHVLVVGMETHVCVFQTVRDLKSMGLQPFVAADAVLSRQATDYDVGLERCKAEGAILTTVELALFDALGKAGTPEFKAVSAAVK